MLSISYTYIHLFLPQAGGTTWWKIRICYLVAWKEFLSLNSTSDGLMFPGFSFYGTTNSCGPSRFQLTRSTRPIKLYGVLKEYKLVPTTPGMYSL